MWRSCLWPASGKTTRSQACVDVVYKTKMDSGAVLLNVSKLENDAPPKCFDNMALDVPNGVIDDVIRKCHESHTFLLSRHTSKTIPCNDF